MPDTAVQTRPAAAAAQTTAAQPTGTAVAKREPTNFEIELAEYEPQFAAVLPDHIKPEHFRRTIITAINLNPDLITADRRSLFTSCVQAAQDGLYPDGREAALVIFNTKVKRNGREEWVKKAQYMPMIQGIRKRMRNTGEVDSAQAQVVYEQDSFDYELGDEPFIKHKPAMGERGKPIGAYAIIKLTNGEIIREVMSVPEIERVRQVSRAANNGPWVSWWTEMARKTVLRRAAKAAPMSPEIDVMLRRDDDLIGDGTEAPALAAPPRPTRATIGAHVMDAETVAGGDEIEGEPEGGEPARDVVIETADTMPDNTGSAQAADTQDAAESQADPFWSQPSYAIEPQQQGKIKAWPQWVDQFCHRADTAPDMASRLKLIEDNGKNLDHLKLAMPARWPEVERRVKGQL